jgi:prepilin-type N-terminal cleavage/methylation domain-containing protein
MKMKILRHCNEKGFTLTELLVAMGLSAVVMVSVGAIYYQQQKSFLAQEQIASAQQNVRASMYFMEREIRSAGYNPKQKGNISIQVANTDSITFQADLDGSGTIGGGEIVTYSFDAVNDQIDRNNQAIAENIDVLNFVYLDGASPPNVLDDDGLGNVTTNIGQIRSVQVTVVARTGRADRGYRDARIYTNLQGQIVLGVQNDHFRRRTLSTTVTCRNLFKK